MPLETTLLQYIVQLAHLALGQTSIPRFANLNIIQPPPFVVRHIPEIARLYAPRSDRYPVELSDCGEPVCSPFVDFFLLIFSGLALRASLTISVAYTEALPISSMTRVPTSLYGILLPASLMAQ